MNKILSSIFILFTVFLLFNCNCKGNSNADETADLDTLAGWMSGYFSSQQQAFKDSAYRDVRLHMVPIWKDRTDGYWLYVEQAVS